jgi:hypothetical protein
MNWLQDKLESIILINCKIHNNQSAGEVVINKLSESTTFLPIYYEDTKEVIRIRKSKNKRDTNKAKNKKNTTLSEQFQNLK